MQALHFADKFPLDYFPILANLFLILANYLSIFHCHLCQRHIGNWSIGIRNREIVAYRRANKCPNFESNKVTSALMQLLVSCIFYITLGLCLCFMWMCVGLVGWLCLSLCVCGCVFVFLFVFHVDVCRAGLAGWLWDKWKEVVGRALNTTVNDGSARPDKWLDESSASLWRHSPAHTKEKPSFLFFLQIFRLFSCFCRGIRLSLVSIKIVMKLLNYHNNRDYD